MNIRQLPYFIAIASCGSLSEAARQLHVSQPALSKYLTELEQYVGMELFYRHKKRLYPTQAGKVYLETAREILAIQTRTKDSIRLLHSDDIQKLHIGISPHRGAVFLAGAFPDFTQQFPQIHLIPHEGYAMTLAQMIRNGEISCAVTSHILENTEDLQFLIISREELVLAVPSFHYLAQKNSGLWNELPFISLSEFRDSSFVMPEYPSALYGAVQSAFIHTGFQPLVAFSSPNVILSESMIRFGVGVGLLPASYAKPDPDIVYFRLIHPFFMNNGFLYKKDHSLSQAERFLIFLLLRQNSRSQHNLMEWEHPLITDIIREFYDTHSFSLRGNS